MINEHDIQAFQDEIWDSLSEEDKVMDVKTGEDGATNELHDTSCFECSMEMTLILDLLAK